MRNITVSVRDEVYRQARIKAAEQGKSVSALVAELLSSLAGEADAEFDRLLCQQEEVMAEIGSFRAADRLSRDEIHARAVR
jgi:plasmid stability protein